MVTLDAVFPYARDLLYYPEHIVQGLPGHNVEEIFFWGSEAPDAFIDIGDVIELKIKSLLAHTSQVQDWVKEAGGEEAFGERMIFMSQRMMRRHNISFKHAEAFRRYGIRRMMEEVGDDS